MAKEKTTKALVPAFLKEQWMGSTIFPNKDILEVVLEEGKEYTEDEVKKLIRDFMKARY